jgi:hypothetical protein
VVFCEDEWIDTLGFEIRSLDDFREASSKCRNLIRPLAIELLRLGVSIVFDFAGNTITSRHWVRAIFEAADVDHLLHVIEASDAECLANIHRRNDEKPPGVYWGQSETKPSTPSRPISPRRNPKKGFAFGRTSLLCERNRCEKEKAPPSPAGLSRAHHRHAG